MNTTELLERGRVDIGTTTTAMGEECVIISVGRADHQVVMPMMPADAIKVGQAMIEAAEYCIQLTAQTPIRGQRYIRCRVYGNRISA